MGFFQKLFSIFHKEPVLVTSPVQGRLMSLHQVSDQTFAQELLGKGVAIMPSDGKIYCPVDGKVENFFRTKHAFSVISDDGAEVLVHVGFDTVKLLGEFFTAHAKDGDVVKRGQLMIEADLEGIANAGYDITTSVVILNTEKFRTVDSVTMGSSNVNEVIMTLRK